MADAPAPTDLQLRRHVERFVPLADDEWARLIAIARRVRVRRRQFIVQPGFVCRYRTYVLAGTFRVYHVDDSGKEHTLSIAVEDWWVTDFTSYLNQSAATHYAEALSAGTVLQFAYQEIEQLCREVHSISDYFRQSTEVAFAHARRRVLSMSRDPAAERYRAYVAQYPTIAQRVPQYVLASYLGITPEFLSALRREDSGRPRTLRTDL